MKHKIMDSDIKFYKDKVMDIAHNKSKEEVKRVEKETKDFSKAEEYKSYLYNELMPRQ